MKKQAHQPGYIALITIVIIGAAGIMIALFLLFTALATSQTSFSVIQSDQAKGAANSCGELALAALQANPNLTTPANGNSTIDATTKAACSYSISGTSPNYTIVAVGTVDSSGINVTRRVTITTNQVTPQLSVSSWKETP